MKLLQSCPTLQAPPPMGFSRQEYWNGLPFPSPGDLPNPGIEPGSLALRADCLLYEPSGKNEDSSNSVNCRCISTFEKAMGDPEN